MQLACDLSRDYVVLAQSLKPYPAAAPGRSWPWRPPIPGVSISMATPIYIPVDLGGGDRSIGGEHNTRQAALSWGNKTWRILATLQCADETGLTGGCRTSPAPGGLPVYMHACTEYLLRPSTHMHDACICQQDYSNFGQGNESSVLILFFLV